MEDDNLIELAQVKVHWQALVVVMVVMMQMMHHLLP
jgi:hypothetical protein